MLAFRFSDLPAYATCCNDPVKPGSWLVQFFLFPSLASAVWDDVFWCVCVANWSICSYGTSDLLKKFLHVLKWFIHLISISSYVFLVSPWDLTFVVLLHRPGCSCYQPAQQAAKVTWSLFPAVTQSDEVIKNSSPELHCCWSMMQGNSDKWRRIQLLEASSSKAINPACSLQNIISNLLGLQEYTCCLLFFRTGRKRKVRICIWD